LIDVEETKLDKLSIDTVAKTFKKDLVKEVLNSVSDSVEYTVGKYGDKKLKDALSGSNPENLVNYWKSYADHIKKYDEAIKEQKASILYDLEVLKNLEAARQEVIDQKDKFDSSEFEIKSWPLKGTTYSDKCHDLIKAHMLKHHFDYFLNRKIENDTNISSVNRYQRFPQFELLCNSEGKFKYIRCVECYKKSILNNSTYSDMCINDEPKD